MALTVVEMCRKRLQNSAFLISHFFIRIPELNMEIHPGIYQKGTFLDINSTKYYQVIAEVYKCPKCIDELLLLSKRSTYAWYYPFINCETLTKGMCLGTAWSNQTITVLALTMTSTFMFVKFEVYTAFLLTLCLVIFVLIYSHFDETTPRYYCGHENATDYIE